MSKRDDGGTRCTMAGARLLRFIGLGLTVFTTLFCGAFVALAQSPQPEDGNEHESTDATKLEIQRMAQEASVDLHNRKPDDAAAAYRKILVLDPGNIEAHSNLGLAYYIQGDFARAGEQFEIVLHERPELWETVALCGLSEVQTGQRENAKVHLQQALDHVQDEKLRMAVGTKLFSIDFEAGDLRQASDVAGTLEQLEPANPDVLYAAHQVYSLLANRAFFSLAKVAPDSARMYQLRGDRMKAGGNLAGAMAAYRRAIEVDDHLAGLHFALAESLRGSQSSSDRPQAETEYERALADNPSDEKAECRLGEIALQRADTLSATRHYKQALQMQPDDPEANEGLGMTLLADDLNREATVYLKRALQLDPTDIAGHYRLSQASKQAGNLEDAKIEMQEYLRLKAQKEALERNLKNLSPAAGVDNGSNQ